MSTGARANSSPAVAAHAEGEEIEVLESGETESGTQADTVSHIQTQKLPINTWSTSVELSLLLNPVINTSRTREPVRGKS